MGSESSIGGLTVSRICSALGLLLLPLLVIAEDQFEYLLECGTVADGPFQAAPAVMLIGGAEANAAAEVPATSWFVNQGGGGNYLVVRTGGVGSQAWWMCGQFADQIASAAELSIDSRAAADKPEVAALINQADMIFIAGGDQSRYVELWRDTLVSHAINLHMQSAPIAGTSAGMAILGSSYYAPAELGMLSSEILDDPFHPFSEVIGHDDFLHHPRLQGVIADTHLDRTHGPGDEFRYGRVFAMLARTTDSHPDRARNKAIGLEEGAFIAVDATGIATVFGNGDGTSTTAYFLVQNQGPPETIESGQPLVWNRGQEAVKVYRIHGAPEGAGSFDLGNWISASGGEWLDWYTDGGLPGFNYTEGFCKTCAGASPPTLPEEIFRDRFEVHD